MSHRGLVAIRRRDGRYDCYDVTDGWAAVSDATWWSDRGPGCGAGGDANRGSPTGTPNVDPTARGVSLRVALDRHLDPLVHETLMVVDDDGEPRTYAVLPYLLATAEGLHVDEPAGAAVSLSGRDGTSLSPEYVRGWHHGVTEVLGEAVDRGHLSPGEAVGWLEDAVRRLAGEGHEVLAVPPSG